jgi:putative molybdopterin biosynthesis protein
MTKEMLDAKDVFEYLNTNRRRVYMLMKAHKIPCARIDGKWLFPKSLINEWIRNSARAYVAQRASHLSDSPIALAGGNDIASDFLLGK